jgi:anthranilate phosphoribosyltransferase
MSDVVRFNDLFPLLAGGGSGGGPPDVRHVRAGFDAILSGEWTPVQVGAFAVILRLLGESTEAIVAGVEAMRNSMTAVETDAEGVLDTCGTGGDGQGTLNLSTAAAVLVSAMGVPVAKHGNRSASSRCSSADVVEELGIPIDVPPARQGDVLREAGIAFLFAQAHHPALRHAAAARRELGIRTIFNALARSPTRPGPHGSWSASTTTLYVPCSPTRSPSLEWKRRGSYAGRMGSTR